MHLWDVCRALTSSVAKFCKDVPTKCILCNSILVLTPNQIFAPILMTPYFSLGNRRLTVSGLKEGRECGRFCCVTVQETLRYFYEPAAPTQWEASVSRKQKWKSAWTPPSHPHTLALENEKVKLFFLIQIQEHISKDGLYRHCAFFVCLQCWGTLLEKVQWALHCSTHKKCENFFFCQITHLQQRQSLEMSFHYKKKKSQS